MKKELPDFIKEGIIGKDTPEWLQIAMANLWECLHDENDIFPSGEYKTFEVIEDIGAFDEIGRAFLIEHKGIEKVVKINIFSYRTDTKPDLIKTSIYFDIFYDGLNHNVLDLVADDNIEFDGNVFSFYHSGRMSRTKKSLLMEFVKKECSENIFDKRYFLGTLKNNCHWNISDDDIVNLLENLISYALIRDECIQYDKKQKSGIE